MRSPYLTGVAAAVLAMVLTACQISNGPDIDPPDDVDVTAVASPTTQVGTIQLAAGETRWVRVAIPSSLRGSGRRLVVEAHDNGGARQLDMVLYDSTGTTATASTSGRSSFRPGLAGLGQGQLAQAAAAFGDVDRAVSVEGVCFGPCIARRAPADLSQVYVRITNAGSTAQNVPFFAWVEPFIDEEEPFNDTLSGAVPVTSSNPYRGAIEILGDVDHVRFTEVGTIVFGERSGYDVNLRMEHYTSGGLLVQTVAPGESITVLSNEYAIIGSAASAPRASVYGFYDVYYD